MAVGNTTYTPRNPRGSAQHSHRSKYVKKSSNALSCLEPGFTTLSFEFKSSDTSEGVTDRKFVVQFSPNSELILIILSIPAIPPIQINSVHFN
jgi:hypothetical protein